MTPMKSIFDFLQFCVNDQQSVPESIYTMDWDRLFSFLQKQSLVGIGFYGCERLGSIGISARPERDLLLKWFSISEQIKAQNKHLNVCAVRIIQKLEEDGFVCCVLKGQGNALMYPDPFCRMPGDIDLLVTNADRERLSKYILGSTAVGGHHYHHIEFQEDGIQIEVHFIPCSENNPIYHRRLQRWFNRQIADGGCIDSVPLPDHVGNIPVPTADFNLVYQLAHIMHHFFDEGIGLRQLMDYYFLVKNEKLKAKMATGNDDLEGTLRSLGLRKFAGAVMYVLQEVFGMEDRYLIVPVDEWRGKTLLEEILRGGNFGHYSGLTEHGMATKYFLKIKRNMRFVRQYPAEALCEPLFRTWHFFWRLWR